jgi:hypothetical protein
MELKYGSSYRIAVSALLALIVEVYATRSYKL